MSVPMLMETRTWDTSACKTSSLRMGPGGGPHAHFLAVTPQPVLNGGPRQRAQGTSLSSLCDLLRICNSLKSQFSLSKHKSEHPMAPPFRALHVHAVAGAWPPSAPSPPSLARPASRASRQG